MGSPEGIKGLTSQLTFKQTINLYILDNNKEQFSLVSESGVCYSSVPF